MHVFSENPVEIADVAVAAAGGNGADRFRTGEKLITGDTDPVIIDVFDECHMNLGFKKAAELPFAHMKCRGKSFECQDRAVMLLNEPEDFFCEQDTGIIPLINAERFCGGIAAEIVPDPEKFCFDEEFVRGKILLIQSTDGFQRGAKFLIGRCIRRKKGLKKQFSGGLPVDVFLLDVIISVAADQFQAEDYGIEGQGKTGRSRDGMHLSGTEKQDISGRNRKRAAIDMGSSRSFGQIKQFVFFMPV